MRLSFDLVCMICASIISLQCLAQEMRYGLFEGVVYKLPSQRKYIKYDPDYASLYDTLGRISWQEINLSHRDTEVYLDDVQLSHAFAIMFNTTLNISEESMYRFSLTSDDGSILWIDDREIISNDYSNGFHSADDTIYLALGIHDVKIWYSQMYPTMYGIIFDSEPVDMPIKITLDTIPLEQDLLFESGNYQLREQGMEILDAFSQPYVDMKTTDIWIIGHTDAIGSEASNLKLSQRRAESIRDYLRSKMSNPDIRFVVEAYGESQPIATNRTAEGRARNRRVEVYIRRY